MRQDCIVSEHIVLDPENRREVTWDEGRAALLISSILSRFKSRSLLTKLIVVSGLFHPSHYI